MTDPEKEIENLKLHIDILRAERDEARKMYCKFVARNEPKYIAERWGWDCFKEDTHD